MATTSEPPQPARHARVLGQKKPAPTHLRVPSDTSSLSKSPNSNTPATSLLIASRSTSPARLDSPVSETSVESSSSVTSDETSQSSLTCPICGESMVTLLQLNRHIDDIHSEIEKIEEDQIKSWFKKKVVKARQLQSVTSVFNNRFSKLDLFDTDDSPSTGESASASQKKPIPAPVPLTPPIIVTRDHWQKPTGFDKCSDVICEKPLNARNGSVNCRKCGKLFCQSHTKYQMKLDKKAHHDPASGVWSRVCETCYKSRPGYLDHTGATRDLTQMFKKKRQTQIDDRELEVNKLEKRLVKLIKVLMDPKFTSDPTNIFSYTKANQRRSAEREIIPWQDDSGVTECPVCDNVFGYSLRKHHCRLCGRVVCASHTTNCSRDAPLSILIDKLGHEHFVGKAEPKNDICIRICQDCKNTVFAKQNFESDLKVKKSDLLYFYDTLIPVRRTIDSMLPQFQDMLMKINNPERPPAPELLHEATKVRRRLLDSFVQFDNTARKVLTIQVHSEEERRLRNQIHTVAAQYLQDHMLPLKALPKVLKHTRTPSQLSAVTSAAVTSADSGGLKEPISGKSQQDLGDEEIQALREQIIILEEQKFLVQGMINEASSRRKFDEVEPLQQNMGDLDTELEGIRIKLGSSAI